MNEDLQVRFFISFDIGQTAVFVAGSEYKLPLEGEASATSMSIAHQRHVPFAKDDIDVGTSTAVRTHEMIGPASRTRKMKSIPTNGCVKRTILKVALFHDCAK